MYKCLILYVCKTDEIKMFFYLLYDLLLRFDDLLF